MQIGFGGEVIKAQCPCHMGKFMVRVYAVVDGQTEDLGRVEFETEQAANDSFHDVVKKIAHDFLNSVGLPPELASKVTVTHGDEAVAAEQRVRNNTNPRLH